MLLKKKYIGLYIFHHHAENKISQNYFFPTRCSPARATEGHYYRGLLEPSVVVLILSDETRLNMFVNYLFLHFLARRDDETLSKNAD